MGDRALKTKQELAARIAALRRRVELYQAELVSLETLQTGCATCEHFTTMPRRGCRLAAGAEPPPEVMAAGCDSWSYDEIPF